eukprot:3965850-Pleurochrysis_carterae.AAC.2
MKIPLVARPRRQNASGIPSARGLALSFPPLQARLQWKFSETVIARARARLLPCVPTLSEMQAGTLTPCPHRRMALPCPTPRMAKSLKPHLSPLTLPAPALVVVGHERITQWGHRPCPYKKVQAQPIPPQSPPQSTPGACSSRDSETRRSVPEGPGTFVPPPNRTRGFEGGGERRHHPLPYQKVRLLPVSSRSR